MMHTLSARLPVAGLDGDHTVDVTLRPIRNTSEYISYQVEILGFLEAEVVDVDALVEWTCDRIVASDPPLSSADIVSVVGVDGLIHLSTIIATGAALPPGALLGYRKLLEVAHKAQDYDSNFDPSCECPACTGHVAEHADCLYKFDRPQLSDSLAAIDWDLAIQCWDLPFFVYQSRLEETRAASRGEAVHYQSRERERRERERVNDEKASIQKTHRVKPGSLSG